MAVATKNTKDTLLGAFRTATPVETATAVRSKATQALETLEIPTTKWEEWKYTRLKSVVSPVYSQKGEAVTDVEAFKIPALEADVLVFVNGVYSASLSQIQYNQDALVIQSLDTLSGTGLEVFEANFGEVIDFDADIFAAANTAYAQQGVLIYVPKNKVAEKPIHILHVAQAGSEPLAVQHRNLFVSGQSSQAKVVETFDTIGEGTSFRSIMTEIVVEANAHLEYVKLQKIGDASSQIDRTEVKQAADSRFSIYTITLNGNIVRNNLRIGLWGQNAEARLNGGYLLDGSQHVDNSTQVDHAVPNCFSDELYKGIVDDTSTGVFSGRINVFRDAQKTNAFQSNRNIVLKNTANIYTKPQLEIYADDVKCSHGATTGRINEEAMFYMRARGIKEEAARMLLIHAFAAETITEISMDAVRDYIAELFETRF